MTVTLRELEEKLGISKQTIRRYVKNELKIQAEPKKTLYLTDEQAALVTHHFMSEKPTQKRAPKVQGDNTEVYDLLKEKAELLERLHTLELKNVELEAKLEAETKTTFILQGEIDKLHEVIEREQAKSERGHVGLLAGFRKLLGPGKE